MDVTATLDARCSADELFACVDDLDRYPSWLEIVPRVQRDTTEGETPAWIVELRGRLGPLARSKRLRMERTAFEPGRHARFERRENDGRDHSPWVLDAVVAADGAVSTLTMRLHYGGGFGGFVLEKMLRDEIDRSRPRLRALVER